MNSDFVFCSLMFFSCLLRDRRDFHSHRPEERACVRCAQLSYIPPHHHLGNQRRSRGPNRTRILSWPKEKRRERERKRGRETGKDRGSVSTTMSWCYIPEFNEYCSSTSNKLYIIFTKRRENTKDREGDERQDCRIFEDRDTDTDTDRDTEGRCRYKCR